MLLRQKFRAPLCASASLWRWSGKAGQATSPPFPLQHVNILECTCHIVSYLADVTSALSQSGTQGTSHLSVDGEERAIEVDSDWVEELVVEEEDSQAEDSVGGPENPTSWAVKYSQAIFLPWSQRGVLAESCGSSLQDTSG